MKLVADSAACSDEHPIPPKGKAARVVVLGSLNRDMLWRMQSLPSPGQTVICHETRQAFGGKGANQAIAAARMGAAVTLIGAVGDDADGFAYRQRLDDEGIDTSSLQIVPKSPTGVAHVYTDREGENQVIVAPGANAKLSVTHVRRELKRWLGSTQVLLAQFETPVGSIMEALAISKKCAVRMMINAAPPLPRFPWGMHAVDYVVVNDHECRAIFNETAETLAAQTQDFVRRFLKRWKITYFVVTRGGRSTLAFSASSITQSAPPAMQPLDTVGAGDTFTGALAAAIAGGMPLLDAIMRANMAAALSTLTFGAQDGMPKFDVVHAAMSKSV